MIETLEQAHALPNDVQGKAVYFLWRDGELLYIGASSNVMERIYRLKMWTMYGKWGSKTSQAKPRIPFKTWTMLAMGSLEQMAKFEKELIKRFAPPWNVKHEGGDEVWQGKIAQERRDALSEGASNGT